MRNIAGTLSPDVTLEGYFAALEAHDWYHEFSDDHRVYREGKADEQRLLWATKDRPDLRRALDAYREAVWDRRPCPSLVEIQAAAAGPGPGDEESN